MKKMIAFLALILLVFSTTGQTSESAGLSHVKLDVFDLAAVRRGAAVYANYCSGCHSLSQMRYSRIQKDLDLPEKSMRNEFMLGDVKIHDTLKSALSPVDGESMFGVAPPDLSLIARSRGVDWVYTYLKGFYADPSRPLGVNNIVAENIAMPNVFWGLQGIQEPVRTPVQGDSVVTGLKLVKPGSQSVTAFDQTVRDLVTFLAYVAKPASYNACRWENTFCFSC